MLQPPRSAWRVLTTEITRELGLNGLQAPAGVMVLRSDSLLAWVLPFGARLMQLFWLNGPQGPQPLTLGFADPQAYAQDRAYLGAVCGRYANRIGGAELEYAGQCYPLDANTPHGHCLHGGSRGWDQRPWHVTHYTADSVELLLDSAHEEMGFPGNCQARVVYRLEGARLVWQAQARVDQDCPINIVQHSYWNLDGQPDLRGHRLQVHAQHYHPVDARELPQAAAPVVGSCFDFRSSAPIAADCVPHVDAALVLDGAPGSLRSVARLQGGGMAMDVSTDRPYLHVYASANLRATEQPLGVVHGPGAALCLETEDMPNGPALGADVWYGSQRDYQHTLALDFSQTA